ncbi:Alcohol acetyltransferase [Moelleriella libera RCEF 2490]|uniref:Alcohol acetyltransferase n=1 Tax=Moelleriella libera RCEF 2490 TaxID=1081109 RepID=A0A167W7E1_9HYPO|nr:Alcohol acetyltransferase [Moelleriella libera RCEF 2490]
MAGKWNHGVEKAALRKFGLNETYQLAMYLLDQYRGTCLTCRYMIPWHLAPAESRAQLEEAVKTAVVAAILRHPMLQVGMGNATSKTPSWIQLQSLDLTHHIKWEYIGERDNLEQTVQSAFRAQLDDRFHHVSNRQPGWKMTIFRQGSTPTMEVVLTWNHPQFDGASARIIQEDLVDILNAGHGVGTRTGLDGDILTLPERPPLLPIPIESCQKLPVTLKVLAKAFWEDVRPQFLNRDASWAAWCPIRSSPYKTQYRAFFVDEASLIAIRTLCRQNKTTITGLLNALALIAFSWRLDSRTAPAFQSSTITDHRRNLPPAPPDAPWAQSERAVANYVSQCLHRYETELVARVRSKLPVESGEERALSAELQRELWAVSARNRDEIVAKLKAGLKNDLIGVYKYVTDWQGTMRGLAKKKRQFTWLVTNLCVLDGNRTTRPGTPPQRDDGQSWSIDRAQFGLSAEIPPAAIEFAPVGVAGHGMCVSANWPDCAVDEKFGERIVGDLERWLAQLAGPSTIKKDADFGG